MSHVSHAHAGLFGTAVGEIIEYATALSASQITLVYNYLLGKWA